MARLVTEGFETGIVPAAYYASAIYPVDGYTQSLSGNYGSATSLIAGRNSLSKYAFYFGGQSVLGYYTWNQTLDRLFANLSELYIRVCVKEDTTVVTQINNTFELYDTSNSLVFYVTRPSSTSYNFYVAVGGSATLVKSLAINVGTWNTIEVYLKKSATVGAYEIKVNGTSIISASGVNTGANSVNKLRFSKIVTSSPGTRNIGWTAYDDIAINDTTGSSNNSWCGEATIVGLRPKEAGNKAQFDTVYGKYRVAETGTGTTSLKITDHGLATDDFIKNTSRSNAVSRITKADDDTLTTATIGSQAKDDVISLYAYGSNVTAQAGTDTNTIVTTDAHGLAVGDIVYNVTRSNYGVVSVINSTTSFDISGTIASMTSGDSVNLYSLKTAHPHWAVLTYVAPKVADGYIQTTTANDIDTFDMQELTADIGVPSGATINAVAHHLFAYENGSGSKLKPVFRISGTDYEGTEKTLLVGYNEYVENFDTSPDTSSAWTRSEVDGLESGVKAI
jgi:hypothetical protein